MAKGLPSQEIRGDEELQRILVDSMMTTLSVAEVFDLDLERTMRRRYELGETDGSFREFANLVATRWRHDHLWTKEGTAAFATGLLLDSTDFAGALYEASDSLEHVEGPPKEKVIDAIFNLIIVYLVSGVALGLDFETRMQERWAEIEKSMAEKEKPCEYHKKVPCGNRGEAVDFPDGVHYICDQGIKEWNETHHNKIFRKGFLSAAGGK